MFHQFGKRDVGVDAGAQDQRVDEHSDEMVERCLTAAGDRCADGDLFGAGQLRHQHGQCAVQSHEHRHSVCPGEVREGAVGVGVDVEGESVAVEGLLHGPRVVGGQCDDVVEAGELLTPVAQLATDDGFRIVFRSEDAVLPQREVRVLHFEWRPGGFGSCRARQVGRHHVACERRHRRTVGADVMDHDKQNVNGFIGVEAEERDAQRQVHRHVETGRGESLHALCEFVLSQRHFTDRRYGLVGGEHFLNRIAADGGEHRPQGFVPLDDVGDRLLHGGDVEVTGEANS